MAGLTDMAHKQAEIKKVVKRELEALGLEPLEFGVSGSNHQYASILVQGVLRRFTFSLTPSVVNVGQIRGSIRWRLREWGWQPECPRPADASSRRR